MQIKLTRFAKILTLCLLLALSNLLLMASLQVSVSKEARMAEESGRVGWIEIADGKVTGKLVSGTPAVVASSSEHAAETSAGAPVAAAPEDGMPLSPAPNEALLEKVEAGFIPKIGADGTKPWRYYSKPSSEGGKAGSIALVITGLGLKKQFSEAATTLPTNVSLAFSVYSHELGAWMMSVRAQGHEFLLEMPLELNHYPAVDAGPLALMTTITPEENLARLDAVLAKTTGYVGFVAPREEVYFAGQKDYVKPVIARLATRGVLMLFAHNEQRSVLDGLLQESALPYLQADIKLEYGASKERTQAVLDSLESIARERGHAIGVIEFSPNTVEHLAPWAETIGARGFRLVPISALARKQFS